jgi:hypothetical protein
MPSDLRITRVTVTHYTTEFADLDLEETLALTPYTSVAAS